MKKIFKNLLKGCKEDEKHPVTVLFDSQVSDCCPWATCLNCAERFYKMLTGNDKLLNILQSTF